MKIISAGWRMEYIGKEGSGECIFCKKAESARDEEALVVYRGRLAFVVMNLYPYTTGHLMVAPYRHAPSVSDLDEQEACEVMQLIGWSEKLLRRALNPDGFNVGINMGKCAGAGYPGHVHVHIVPRWEGDTNFMPVVSETKVLPEILSDTYGKIMETARGFEEA
jgi:ATP adenylyltransferase